jgi:hypothetical protein
VKSALLSRPPSRRENTYQAMSFLAAGSSACARSASAAAALPPDSARIAFATTAASAGL